MRQTLADEIGLEHVVKFDITRIISMLSCIFWFTLNERKKNAKAQRTVRIGSSQPAA